MGFLSDLLGDVRRDLDRRPIDVGPLMGRIALLPPARGFARSLRASEAPAVIAELKRSSPSAGLIGDADPGVQAAGYERGGAAAVSVLTEPRHFGGSLVDLRAVRMATSIPVLRKDFLIHPDQLIQSRAEGADAVLLIAAALERSELVAMLAAAADLGLDVLAEAHTEQDLEAVVTSGAEVVGVNARDLETLDVDLDRAIGLLRQVPEDRIAVLESGIGSPDRVRRAADAGAGAVLVGEALMRSGDPERALRALRGAPA
ncbi:MAG TPA: indole-3-glycerol phosphate synthase TrpC [Actinomycetota bacterium]|jgi:indole-3-glycerol phosphate synthase|nr:indole-3-glycerol phosphate synthase TrpC [Actinomycetota bacterium]